MELWLKVWLAWSVVYVPAAVITVLRMSGLVSDWLWFLLVLVDFFIFDKIVRNMFCTEVGELVVVGGGCDGEENKNK